MESVVLLMGLELTPAPALLIDVRRFRFSLMELPEETPCLGHVTDVKLFLIMNQKDREGNQIISVQKMRATYET